MKTMPKLEDTNALATLQEQLKGERSAYPICVTLSSGTCGQASGSMAVLEALEKQIGDAGLNDQVHVRVTGCHGFCQEEPLLIVDPLDVLYCQVKPEDVAEIVSESLAKGTVVERLLYSDDTVDEPARNEAAIPFFAQQNRILMGQNRFIDPMDIDDYLANGGYSALAKALGSMTPEEVIEETKASGLRGRGGGGYPAGRKWEQCKAAEGDDHYVICNADEGDPGAYMDRGLLEGNPHAIIEGMLIAAFAIDSKHGFVYVRNEYPLAIKHTRKALEQAREYGLLGDGILGTDFSCDLKIVRGGGAFVCGESTALMASLEGKVGEPRAKDVHTVEHGYLDQPTCLNNVETWANVPGIIANGAEWFAQKGTEGSKGTKIFALTGQVKNTGLVEVEMGASLRDVIFGIGGGPKSGRAIKAVQTGGPSGGCVPASEFDLPVDFDALYEAGSMMGSGGMVVMDDSACMVDVAKYFLTFLQGESCGKCVTCRVGIDRMLEIVTDISEGQGTMEQLELLEDLAWTVSVGSLCALGKTAPNPVLSTLKHFREEYLVHIEEKKCPAKACRKLIHFDIDEGLCTKCGKCVQTCPHTAISGDAEAGYTIDDATCSSCGICVEGCEPNAITIT
jgi:NADH:ubiquinone oxidoreductase subunit F (NADH-binding)/(2Fe-2S) ferredoxin